VHLAPCKATALAQLVRTDRLTFVALLSDSRGQMPPRGEVSTVCCMGHMHAFNLAPAPLASASSVCV